MTGNHTIRKFYNEKENREIGNINICQPVPHKELAAEILDKGFFPCDCEVLLTFKL